MEVAALVLSGIAALAAVAAAMFALGQKRAADRSAIASAESAVHARRSADAAQEAVGYQRAEIEQARLAALVPPDELMDRMLDLEGALSDIVAAGGQESIWFLERDRQKSSMRLAVLAGQVLDDKLNDLLGEARNGYQECWAMAPGHGAPDPTRRSQAQTETARRSRASLTQAIDRLNELVRNAASRT